MSEDDKNKNQVNEPQAEYTASQKISTVYNTLTISSFEKMREDNYLHWLSLTPEQRLAEHYVLITSIYKDELEKNKNLPYDKIYFPE